jgi:cell division protein FtsX
MRCLSAAAVLAGVALLAGCGSGHSAPTTTSVSHHFSGVDTSVNVVEVFFCSTLVCPANATRSQEQLVGVRLRHEPCVRKVVFISKAQAWAMFKKKHSKLAGASPPGMGNPLPDSFKITPDKRSCVATIAATARAAHWPGVQKIAP